MNDELVRQEIALARGALPMGEVAAVDTVFARAMMLETDAAHAIGEREQEVVVIVVLVGTTTAE